MFKQLLGPFTFCYAFVTLVVSIMGLQVKYNFVPRHTPPMSCYQVFVKGLETDNSKGIWECLSPDMQASTFQGLDWNGPQQVQQWIDHFYGSSANLRSYLAIDTFSGNPIKRCLQDSTGKCVVDSNGVPTIDKAYLIYVTPTFEDDPYVDVQFIQGHNVTSPGATYTKDTQAASSLTILIGSDGKIAQLQ